ncbi:MAG: tRNA (adenosine(37)-N6)-dimethylallyltransferase MiaA [Rhodothermaceae bacterium]
MERVVVTIIGPTCSGKTSLSLMLAEELQTEIISADSRQIFKYLSIGTAKPTKEETDKIKHHFIDTLEPDVNYNISKFEIDGLKVIEDLFSKNKIPVVVGGSGLYIKALVDGIINDVETDDEYRAELMKQREEFGNEHIYNILREVDPQSAENMLPQNWKRVIRALEVFHISGKPIWQHHNEQKRDTDIKFLQYGLNWDREILYKNIEKRVDQMVNDGLLAELQNVLEMGFDRSVNALNTVGYKELYDFIDEKITLERAIELIKRDTRRFAKRQFTWFRRDERIKWFDVNSASDLSEIKNSILKDLELKTGL